MALIVAGRFPTFEKAESAAAQFFSRGFKRQDISIFFVTPPGQHAKYAIGGDQYADPVARSGGWGAVLGISGGAIAGAMIGAILYAKLSRFWLTPVISVLLGAYAGSFIGALARMRKRAPRTPQRLRQGNPHDTGVMLAAHVTEKNAQAATHMLEESGAAEVEKVTGVWQNGRWQDFDPTAAPRKGV